MRHNDSYIQWRFKQTKLPLITKSGRSFGGYFVPKPEPWGNLGTFTTLRGKKGAEEFIAMQRTLQTHQKTLGVLRGAVIWGYLGLACRLSGCGGWI
jgi:hypothetical protein